MMSWIGRQLKPSLTPSLEETDVFLNRFSSDRFEAEDNILRPLNLVPRSLRRSCKSERAVM